MKITQVKLGRISTPPRVAYQKLSATVHMQEE